MPLDEVLAVLTAKDDMKHVVVTGRNAKEELIEIADLVTEMVGEFPELQGLMGGYYAAKEGLPQEVAEAIRADLAWLGIANRQRLLLNRRRVHLGLCRRHA